jgi:hypothetical protein
LRFFIDIRVTHKQSSTKLLSDDERWEIRGFSAKPGLFVELEAAVAQLDHLSACPKIVDLVGDLLTNGGQVEKLCLDENVFRRFSEFPIFNPLFPMIIRDVHVATFGWHLTMHLHPISGREEIQIYFN